MSNNTLTEYEYKYLFHYVRFNNGAEYHHRTIRIVADEYPSEEEIMDLEKDLSKKEDGRYDVVGFYRLSSC